MTDWWKQCEGQVADRKFPLREFLGGRGRSAVFRTEFGDSQPCPAAIKLVVCKRAQGEAQLVRWRRAERLSHPHLIRLLATGQCEAGGEDVVYAVMEQAEEDLSQILPERALTPEEVREMLGPVLEALAFLHAQNLAHTRIKPSNIMAMGNQVKLSSDGIRAAGEFSLGREKPGDYDAPEIAREGYSPAGDVWSLGMTLVETLTQRRPVRERQDQDPISPATLPPPFLDIARGCLRRDATLRFTLGDVSNALQPSRAGAEKVSPSAQRAPAARPARAAPAQASPKWRAYVPAAAIGLIALGVVVFAPRLFGPRSARPQPSAAPAAAAPSPAASEPIAPAGSSAASAPAASGSAVAGPAPAESGAASQPSRGNSQTAATAGAEIIQGQVSRQVLPLVPESARDTIRGTIRVRIRVQVSAEGDVVGADFDLPGPSKYFARLAMDAARRWKFTPARAGGRKVPSEYALRFDFASDSTKAFPAPPAP